MLLSYDSIEGSAESIGDGNSATVDLQSLVGIGQLCTSYRPYS